ncbi:uncharacterized protein isoform X2 [Rhodnius prolixus]|uniref:uncharacterized protein isoform X2 n=1 Tax=Rhodnius prolixus TaxID=13249 RepID=UPI003D188A5C
MLPNGAVLVQQQTSSGVQLILKSPPPQTQPKPGIVLANGSIQPQAVIVQGRTQAHQVLRLVPGQMHLQQIQTSSGPTLIAVPSPAIAQQPKSSSPSPQHNSPTNIAALAQKKIKKKKKKEEEPRLDLANLIKISGIDEEDVSPAVNHNQLSNQSVNRSTCSSPRPSTPRQQPIQQQQLPVQHQAKQMSPTHLLSQLQAHTPSQVGNSGLRVSVGEDGTMLLHQAEQQTTVTPSIAAAAQSQLAQLIAEHGGQILQSNASLSNNSSKETSFMQSLQTAVLHLTGSGAEGVVLKGNLNAGPVVVNATGVRRGATAGSMVVTPTLQQNGVRFVTDLNGLQHAGGSAGGASSAAALAEHNRLIVSGLTPAALLEQNRVQIVTGVPTSTAAALSLEQQQNRLIVSGNPNVLAQQGRVLVSAGSLEQQNRLQIVTSTNSAVSLSTEQNRVIVSNMPSNVSLDQQNRLQILSGVPTSNVSLTEQNRVQIVSGIQNSLTEQNRVILSGVQGSNMSLEQQNRVQILSGGQNTGTMALEQNRVQIMSGVQSSLTEQQNRLQIVSGVPNSNTLSLSEQNRVHIVSNMPSANTLLSEKQNVVQIVNSNISLSEEQNRLQIVSNVGNASLTDQNRLHVVNSLPNSNSLSLSDQNQVHMVNVPVSSSVPLCDSSQVQLVTSLSNSVPEQSRIHFSSIQNLNSGPQHEQKRLQIITSVPNSLSLSDQSKVQVVTSLPTNTVFNENQNKVQVVSNSVTQSNVLSDQRQKGLVNFQEDSHIHVNDQVHIPTSLARNINQNVQVVSALVNNDKKQNAIEGISQTRDGVSGIKFQPYIKPSEIRIIAQNVHKEKDLVRTEEREDKQQIGGSNSSETHSSVVNEVPRVQFVSNNMSEDCNRMHVVGANNHTNVTSQGSQVVRGQVIYPSETLTPKISKNSVGTGASYTGISSPPPSSTSPFNNRPNLTVVTQPQRTVEQPVQQSNKNEQVTKTQQSQTQTLTQTHTQTRRTYDNAFLDSIAQAHPNLVINKSPAPITSPKLAKTKKPIKKAALVKPMMAEDRTCPEKEDSPNLVPISVSSNDHNVVSRVQTIQLTPQKQQQLKQIQAQVTALSNNKFRTSCDQATLQRLISEQHKIILGGKIVPTVPGQHAQGVTFVSNNSSCSSVRLVPVSASNRVPTSKSEQTSVQQSNQISVVPPLHQHHSSGTTSANQPNVTTHANKATSPIPLQQQVSTQTPLQAPPQPIFSRAKRASLIEQQMQADRQGALAPDTKTPFLSKSDAVKRLIRYHTMNEPVLSEKDLAKADELFEQTAKHLLDKKNHMYNKYTFLILKESTRLQQTSELVLLERLFVNDETARLEQSKQEAASPTVATSSVTTAVKRERDDCDAIDSKKHCPDDEEINAQVQSAIDSILNLQRNDAVEEAVRSIPS